ncbi:LPP20 family lipoprotein [Sulfurimonas sp.]
MRVVALILAVSMLMFLSACGSKKRVVVNKTALPAWYMHPPQSNEKELYGVGEGKDKQEAVLNALNMMLSTLSISISSDYRATTVIKEGTHFNSHDATYVNEVQSHMSTIRISNYEVLQRKKLGFKKYAVLLKADKTKIFNSLREELDLEFNSIYEAQKIVQKENAIFQLAFYRDALNSFGNLKEKLLIMSTLKSQFDSTKYLQKYEALKKSYEDLKAKITFTVLQSKKIGEIKSIIESALVAKKFKIQKNKGARHFTISIKVDTTKSLAYGFILLHANIMLQTKDVRGVVVGSNSLSVSGQSSTTYDVAMHNVVRKFQQIVDEKGVAKILGLDI